MQQDIYVVSWKDGRVSIADSVEGTPELTGEQLERDYWSAIHEVTLGLVRRSGDAVALGPIDLLRFGPPQIGARSVQWPIEGGWLAAGPGGRWRVSSDDVGVVAAMEGFRPMLPRPLYAISHQLVHLLFTRLYLLKLRTLAPGVPAAPADRRQAALVDVALCVTLMQLAGLRLRPRTFLGVLAGYHIACWSTSGRTFGGLVMRQRVVARDGKRVTPTQAALRLWLLPLSWIVRRPIHDQVASTEVIKG